MSASGICLIKPEYVLPEHTREVNLECVSNTDKAKLKVDNQNEDDSEVPHKKQKLSKKQKLRGQNKARGPTFKRNQETELCHTLINLTVNEELPKCERKNCQFLHDAEEYLKIKPEDIGKECYNYQTSGRCSRGLTCRFATQHITDNHRNKVDESKYTKYLANGPQTINQLTYEVQNALRKRKYDFTLSEKLIKYNDQIIKENRNEGKSAEKQVGLNCAEKIVPNSSKIAESEISDGTEFKNDIKLNDNLVNDYNRLESVENSTEIVQNKIGDVTNQESLITPNQSADVVKIEISTKKDPKNLINLTDNLITESLTAKNNFKPPQNTTETSQKTSGSITDEDIIKLLSREKKTIDFKKKLFLSPLTTVGNLPFRRICKEFGADITCGEMAMCSSLLQGAPQEWALVKRHASEDIFGVQLCANNPHLLTKCAQLLEREAEIDFVDLNLGCPIELVYRQGGGCGLLRRPRVLEACVRGLSGILSVPLTIKTRTGVYSDESVAHELLPKFRDWGASLVTVHGRSREQRYTKQADWQYIRTCAKAAFPLSVVGNGDVLSYEDYKTATETCPELCSVMIGRGALIKPWLFTEIKEGKLWDISSGERFDILKKYVNYGLEHWGSDTKGVENTRRFLLEWLSFLHRYVPVGVLERPPQKINERPPYYKGRDDMETLMASTSASDWVKISEMLLGKVPEDFRFLPKHKANSYK